MKNWLLNRLPGRKMDATPADDQLDAIIEDLMRGLESFDDDAPNAELLGVLEVFPDINIDFVSQLLEEGGYNFEEVLATITDMGTGYPRDDIAETTSETTTIQTKDADVETVEPLQPAPPAYDFSSPTSFSPSYRYKMQSVGKLVYDFPFLDYRVIAKLFEQSSSHYAIAFDRICQTVPNKAGADEMLLCVLDKVPLKTHEIESLAELFKVKMRTSLSFLSFSLQRRNTKMFPRITCPILTREIEYVDEKAVELKTTLEAGITRRKRREAAIHDGTAMTCSCCYDELPPDEMVACMEEGHLLCAQCLRKYVETRVFGNGSLGVTKDKEAATEILCCHGDCTSGFSMWALKKALNDKVMLKYDELQYKTTIEKAGLSESM